MAYDFRKPILITGSHRSGTTWVGRMLSTSSSVGYIQEPFNIEYRRPGVCSADFPCWFAYITKENESNFCEHIKNTYAFRYNLAKELKALKSLKDVGLMVRDYGRVSMYRFRNVMPLVKDPIAVFSAEWLASTFDMNVVVLIRHPAAFASSLKRKNWRYKFRNFLQQPLLMRDHLHPFEKEIREYTEAEHDIIDQSALLWKIIYYMIMKYQKNHDDWIFIRHEDLSRNPIDGFQTIFNKLNLKFTGDISKVIKKHSDPLNPSEPSKGGDSIIRDSESNILNWKKRLTPSEIERIRNKVEDISSAFYSNEDW